VAQGDQKKRIEQLWKLTEPGARPFLESLYNTGACECEVDGDQIAKDLKLQFEFRKEKGASPNINGTKAGELIDDIADQVIKDWKKVISSGTLKTKSSIKIKDIGSTNSSVIFVIYKGKSEKTGGVNKGASNNFKIFKETNNEIFGKIINSKKYTKLFEGYSRNQDEAGNKNTTGPLRSIVDVGHVKALSAEGRASAAVGIINGILNLQGKGKGDGTLRKIKGNLLKLGLSIDKKTVFSSTKGQLKFIEKQSYTIEPSYINKGSTNRAEETKKEKEVLQVLGDGLKEVAPSAEEYIRQTGSTTFIDTVGDMIVNTPLKKKAYKSKKAVNLTKYKKAVTTKTGTSNLKKEKKMQGSSGRVKVGLTSGMAAKAPKAKGAKTEKGDGVSPETYANKVAEALIIKRAINKRLPAEILKNMGRPALNNRTGRFRTSAMIEDITPAAKTLMVKYTYRLNPYETFENTGERRWPNGYNPKPLISKSIRNLAIGMFKITALTTRRV
jgi:hypothetical protein